MTRVVKQHAVSSTPQSGEPTDVRSAILDAAVDLFYRQGYAATGVQQVVDAAGRTKGAFYHYWDSKESLLLEIHDTFHLFANSRARELMERDLTPDVRLHELIVDLFRQLELYRRHMTVVFQQALYTPYAKYPKSKALRDEYEEIVKTVIQDGIDTGVFRSDLGATNVLAYGAMSFSFWATNWYRPGGARTAEEIGETYARVYVDGLRKH